MVWKPRVTVAVVAERQQRFLMVEEKVAGLIRFNQPAGHLEDGESLPDAAIRECLEETAWHFEPTALVGIYRWRSARNAETYLRVCFCGRCVPAKSERMLDEEIVAVHWLTLDEIRYRSARLRSPLVLRSIEDYLQQKRYPLDLLIDLHGEDHL
jgi:8-oxo-dGTP pyrophosphatase MutT (NUDIX family)